jgi:hypothetical protein
MKGVPSVAQLQTSFNRTSQAVTATAEYGKTAAGTIALVSGLFALTGLIFVIGTASRLPLTNIATPIELIQTHAEFESEDPDNILALESREIQFRNPAPPDFRMMLEIAIELSDSNSQQVENAIRTNTFPISLNDGGGGGGARSGNWSGVPNGHPGREQRWRIMFYLSDLATYAKQLDFFKIELGALFKDGRLVFIKNMSAATPLSRVVFTGKAEDRLYMKWRAGTRRDADVALFRKAGIPDADDATILHFYGPETEQLLARTEVAYRNHKSAKIRSTYFTVEEDGAGYKFVVKSQSYRR